MMKFSGFNWIESFPKTCIVVKGKHPHVRDYKRPIKHGINRIHAEWNAAYDRAPIEFKELFRRES